MLTPHEFATLMLVREGPDQIDPGRAELDTLVERHLVAMERLASGRQQPHLTDDGDSILKAVARAVGACAPRGRSFGAKRPA
ncbi:MAG: hypothetical protein WBR17_04705 [Paraburkholderia sp.]|uniref:hypothetical protein n=1 Tax=Paraburkholderia sp. TaxID=1926495 RepID=UPI003C6B62F1